MKAPGRPRNAAPRYNVVLDPKDLRRDTMRAGGPGGQHQNKTESAVRYTHVPTGISAESRSERSQSVNDEYALELLKEKILRLFLLKRGESVKDAWKQKPDPSFGSKMRSYVLAGSSARVVDHETGWKGEPRKVLDGQIGGMLDARLRMAARSGFTLVELLVVIVIIAILTGLLLPVIGSAVRTAKNGAQTAEFDVLAAKLEAFKVQYGSYPPSRIILPEDGAWNVSDATPIPVAGGGTDITYGQLNARTVEYLRRFWPGMPVSTTATPLFDGAGTWYDWDGDGRFDAPTVAGRGRVLDGCEALVFWLGGIPLDTGTTGDPQISLSGFARGKFSFPGLSRPHPHPARNNLDDGNRAFGRDRDPVFHEFPAGRLADADGDGFPEYADSLTGRPIAWFRPENGGYDPNDVNLPEPDTDGATPVVLRRFRVGFVNSSLGRDVMSPAPNPYSVSPANTGTTTAWHRANSFQLLSAGADGLYGPGGRYKQDGKTPEEKLPLEATTVLPSGTMQNLNTTDRDVRSPERDNISNFSSGPLD